MKKYKDGKGRNPSNALPRKPEGLHARLLSRIDPSIGTAEPILQAHQLAEAESRTLFQDCIDSVNIWDEYHGGDGMLIAGHHRRRALYDLSGCSRPQRMGVDISTPNADQTALQVVTSTVRVPFELFNDEAFEYTRQNVERSVAQFAAQIAPAVQAAAEQFSTMGNRLARNFAQQVAAADAMQMSLLETSEGARSAMTRLGAQGISVKMNKRFGTPTTVVYLGIHDQMRVFDTLTEARAVWAAIRFVQSIPGYDAATSEPVVDRARIMLDEMVTQYEWYDVLRKLPPTHHGVARAIATRLRDEGKAGVSVLPDGVLISWPGTQGEFLNILKTMVVPRSHPQSRRIRRTVAGRVEEREIETLEDFQFTSIRSGSTTQEQ